MNQKLHQNFSKVCYLFMFLVMGLSPFELKAQVTSYLFSQSNGTYTSLASPTNLVTATGNSGIASMDTYTAPITFPDGFTFTFNGTVYTVVNVNSNGYLTFGTTTATGSSPISQTTAYDGAIAIWGRDLNGMFNVNGITSTINYALSGVAPNRVFTVEYNNFRPVYSSSTTAAYAFNLQVKLHETTNAIDMVYGPGNYVIGSTAVASTAQIGLRGATNADYINRLNATSLAFNASTAGTANSSTQSFSSSANPPGMPAAGLTYTFTPSNCYAPGGLSANAVTTSSATINWTAATPAPGNGYEYYYSTSATAPTSGTLPSGSTAAGVTSASISPLSPSTVYNFWVRSSCSVGISSIWSSAGSFSTNCLPTNTLSENFDSYATGSIVPTCWARLVLGSGTQTIASTTPASGTRNLYQTSTSAANATFVILPELNNVNAGTNWLRFKARSTTTNFAGVMEVGYMTDISDAASFTLINSLSIPNSAYGVEYTVSIPATVPPSSRLAVRNSGGMYGSSFYWDDVIWEARPSCVSPSNIAISNLTTTSATVSWNAALSNPSNGYIYYFSTDATPPTAATPATAATNNLSIPFSSLSPSTNYYIWVKSVCNATDSSSWGNVAAFITLPANDLPSNAVTLNVGEGCTATYTNVGATDVVGEPYSSCKGTTSFGSVWFKFVAPASGAVKVSNDNTVTGTVMGDSRNAMFTATDPNDFSTFTSIACDDDNGSVSSLKSIFYATGLIPGNTYYVLNACHAAGGARGTFCLTIDELNGSMIATTGSCTAGQNLTTFNADYKGWLSIVSTDSKLIALIKQNAGTATTFTPSITVNTGAVRTDGNNKKYLDRNLSVTTTGTATDVDMRLFFLPAELAALQVAEPNTVMGNLSVSHVSGTTCVANNTGTAGTILTQTGNAVATGYNFVQVNTPGFSNFYINGSSEPLPVTLRTFEGKNEGNTNLLNWSTSNEINFSHFELEKSADGIRFNKLVSLEARGIATNGNYDYRDQQPFKEHNFYRLKIVDKNGQFIYSNVVMLTIKGNGSKVLAFPNPSHDYVMVQSVDASKAIITLTDATGKVVQTVETNSGTTKLNLNGLATGFYTLRYQSDSFVEMIKIMKQ